MRNSRWIAPNSLRLSETRNGLSETPCRLSETQNVLSETSSRWSENSLFLSERVINKRTRTVKPLIIINERSNKLLSTITARLRTISLFWIDKIETRI
jgi:hypothetical protein